MATSSTGFNLVWSTEQIIELNRNFISKLHQSSTMDCTRYTAGYTLPIKPPQNYNFNWKYLCEQSRTCRMGIHRHCHQSRCLSSHVSFNKNALVWNGTGPLTELLIVSRNHHWNVLNCWGKFVIRFLANTLTHISHGSHSISPITIQFWGQP